MILKQIVCFLAFICTYSAVAASASYFDIFIDPQDGKMDISQWLAGGTGFLPIPLIISDPAVGYGGGLGLAFLHDQNEQLGDQEDPNAMLALPPSVSFVAGAYTENDSSLVAGGHVASWKNDSIRYTGIAAYGDLSLGFYGTSSEVNPDDLEFGFNIKGFYLLQEIIFRYRDSNLFAGGRYSFLSSDVGFDLGGDIPGVPAAQFDDKTGGLGIIFRYDSWDNLFSPNKGNYFKLEPVFYNEVFGGDYNYLKAKVAAISYLPLSSFVLGIRAEADFSDGDAPFYDTPFIVMRGIPSLRYQGDHVLVGELELRWNITPRWSQVGFFGSGWTADSIGDLMSESGETAGGVGFRYLIARRYGLRVGIDVAAGPEDEVAYLAVGANWN